MFLDSSGDEIERVVGYKTSDEFIDIINNVVSNTNTFSDLFLKYNNGSIEPNLIDQLSFKSEIRNDTSLCNELYGLILAQRENFDLKTIERAEFYFSKIEAKNGNLNRIKIFIKQFSESDKIQDAYRVIINYYKSKKDIDMEIETHQKLVSIYPDQPSILNSYAWRMTELDRELKDALKKINHAINLIDKNERSYSNILDTKAEVLWKMRLFDEAINIIEEAISIDPESKYYKDQKLKFKNSKEGV
tara:strand:+ start:377 stop:1114 length:738 start_codon:yes stop_codon:yes gene_type:complete